MQEGCNIDPGLISHLLAVLVQILRGSRTDITIENISKCDKEGLIVVGKVISPSGESEVFSFSLSIGTTAPSIPQVVLPIKRKTIPCDPSILPPPEAFSEVNKELWVYLIDDKLRYKAIQKAEEEMSYHYNNVLCSTPKARQVCEDPSTDLIIVYGSTLCSTYTEKWWVRLSKDLNVIDYFTMESS